MKAAIMISDERMNVIADELKKDGLEVLACCTEEDMETLKACAGEWDLLLLPIRGIDCEGYVAVPGVKVFMGEVMSSLKPEALVITGLQTEYLKNLDRKVLCYFEDEQVRWQNVRLTAEGILYLLLKETKKSIFAQSIDLTGYGYVGKAAHELLKKLEIPHRLVDRAASEAKDGTEVLALDAWKCMEPAPVIVNSIPALVADEETGSRWPEDTVFLDIASGGAGACENVKRRIHYVAAPPLPGLVARESAGLMLAEYVRRQLRML